MFAGLALSPGRNSSAILGFPALKGGQFVLDSARHLLMRCGILAFRQPQYILKETKGCVMLSFMWTTLLDYMRQIKALMMRMYTCIRTYIYTCMCVHVYVYMYVPGIHSNICICEHIYLHIICKCMLTHVQIFTHWRCSAHKSEYPHIHAFGSVLANDFFQLCWT